MNSSNSTEIQTLFTILLDSVLAKVSNEHKIKLDDLKSSIGSITFTDNLNDSINNFCSSLNPVEVPKPKRVLKKSVPKETLEEKIETANEVVEAPKPKKILKKTIPTVTETKEPLEAVEEKIEAATEVEAPKPKKILKKTIPTVTETTEPVEVPKPKKVLKKAIPTDKVDKVVTENTESVEVPNKPLEVPIQPVEVLKPKKVLKKAIPTDKVVTENTESVEAPIQPVEVPKPKKVLKKAILVTETIEPVVEKIITDIVVEEPEVKIKPKKIIVKRQTTETLTMPEPQKKKSIKEVDVVEYGSEEQHDENAAVYDSIQMYEDDLLEPREINGVKYLIDSSEYIYDMESQELLGKLSEKDKTNILFLKNFPQ